MNDKPYPRDESVWRNNKNGKNYLVIGVAKHSETEEVLVVYTSSNGQLWVRPFKLFLEKFTWMHD